MNAKTVSVVIPIYNVEPYLKQSLDSVINQTYGNLEIILVDDGSTDKSAKICDEIAQTDSRVKVLHKPNGGLSEARNAGTTVCTGEYLLYLDSDDYLEPDAVEQLMLLRNAYNADAVMGNYFYTYSDHESLAEPDAGENSRYSRREAILLLMQGKLQTFAWGKLIRADVAKRHPFPVGKLFEDHFWTHLVFQDCETVVYTSKPMVHYRQRDNSISYTFNLSRLDIMDGWRERIAFLRQEYPEMVEAYLRRCAGDAVSLAWLVLTRMNQNRKQGFVKIREFTEEYRLAGYSDGRVKMLLTSLTKSDILYAGLALLSRFLGG